jgi:hypothetical protein
MADLRDDIHFDLEEIFQEVLRRREAEGAFDQESYNQFVEDVVQEKIDRGEIDDDDDTEEWIEQLQNRWVDVQELDGEQSSQEERL